MDRNRHHRLPKSRGGREGRYKGEPMIKWVNSNHHYFWHLIFKNKTAPEIFDYINSHWIDPHFKIVLVRR